MQTANRIYYCYKSLKHCHHTWWPSGQRPPKKAKLCFGSCVGDYKIKGSGRECVHVCESVCVRERQSKRQSKRGRERAAFPSQLMRIHHYRQRPRIPAGLLSAGCGVGRDPLMDEFVEAVFRSSRVTVCTHLAGVLVQKAEQRP